MKMLDKSKCKRNFIIKNSKLAMKENGITLIALIITIIVLLILAAVSIATLIGQNGILSRADEAAEETGRKTAEEKVAVEVLGSYGRDGNLDYGLLKDNLNNIEGIQGVPEEIGLEDFPLEVIVDGYTVIINEDGNVSANNDESSAGETVTLPVTEDTKPYLPNGAEIIESDLDKGVVIKDSNNNEWVWIEVPKSIYTNTEYNGGIAPSSSEDYEKIESTMQNYAIEYRDSNYEDKWYSEEQHGFVSSTDYDNWKKSMLKSVYENGGFYIGRYEVGSFDNLVTANDNKGRSAVIQEGAYPYNWVTCKQAQELSEGLATGGRTSSLMFGIQWDLVLKYLEIKGDWDTSTNTALYYLKENSNSWGNYRDISFSVKSGSSYAIYSDSVLERWDIVPVGYNKPSYSSAGYGVLLSTGAAERNCKMNIYDLAGNVWEWTLEKSNELDSPCTARGGYYASSGANLQSSYHDGASTSHNLDIDGFRSTLW